MKTYLLTLVATAILCSPLSGCAAARKEVAGAPADAGKQLEIEADYGWAVREARAALEHAGYKVIATDNRSATATSVIGKLGASMQSWGHHVRLTVQDSGSGKVTLAVVTAKHIKVNVTEPADHISQKILDYYKTAAAAVAGSQSSEDLF